MPTLPTIHMNGTSKADLLDGYCAQMSAIRTAIDALLKNGPNGRDYYPQGPDALAQAIKEHHDRVTALHGVLTEIESIAEAIA